jgi:hypothetical protein
MIGPAGFGAAPKDAAPLTLRDVVPQEFFAEFMGTPAARLLDVEVLETVDGTLRHWPGTHRCVFTWWKLADGHRVGFNENPSRGWSFPVERWRAGL